MIPEKEGSFRWKERGHADPPQQRGSFLSFSRVASGKWAGTGPNHMAFSSLLFIFSGLGKKCGGGNSEEALAKVTLQ